ncbi:MAG TPA: MGMT family protein [Spongiibacteraceae bacterium]|jgi:methylated-DNA-protein-cysteine methyltransferase-like protein|nr:MGMT family protein [Spongiibacteraceae bacterium]HUH36397.1 MGMT family protein [Spongiibacteraceae bacterium]
MHDLQRMDHPVRTEKTSQHRIWQVLGMIPKGKVVSYGELARIAELAGAARHVGRVLRALPDDTRLPWHRVVRANGAIAQPVDSPGYHEQIARLQAEGVEVRNGRVSMRRCAWRP